MAIAKNPRRNTIAAIDQQASAFISGAGKSSAEENRKPIMIRIPPELLQRIDAAAKRLGLTRSAFIVQASARALEE